MNNVKRNINRRERDIRILFRIANCLKSARQKRVSKTFIWIYESSYRSSTSTLSFSSRFCFASSPFHLSYTHFGSLFSDLSLVRGQVKLNVKRDSVDVQINSDLSLYTNPDAFGLITNAAKGTRTDHYDRFQWIYYGKVGRAAGYLHFLTSPNL